MTSLFLAAVVSYQVVSGLPLKHDGYVVEKRGTGNGERVSFVVKAETERAFLYANYESNRWMNAKSYPFVRDPHFKTRALDANLWRLRLLKRRKEEGAPTDALLRQMEEGLANVRRLGRAFPREMGSPVSLMADICSQARE